MTEMRSYFVPDKTDVNAEFTVSLIPFVSKN